MARTPSGEPSTYSNPLLHLSDLLRWTCQTDASAALGQSVAVTRGSMPWLLVLTLSVFALRWKEASNRSELAADGMAPVMLVPSRIWTTVCALNCA